MKQAACKTISSELKRSFLLQQGSSVSFEHAACIISCRGLHSSALVAAGGSTERDTRTLEVNGEAVPSMQKDETKAGTPETECMAAGLHAGHRLHVSRSHAVISAAWSLQRHLIVHVHP